MSFFSVIFLAPDQSVFTLSSTVTSLYDHRWKWVYHNFSSSKIPPGTTPDLTTATPSQGKSLPFHACRRTKSLIRGIISPPPTNLSNLPLTFCLCIVLSPSQHLDPSKAPSWDGTPIMALEISFSEFTTMLHFVFKPTLFTITFPRTWEPANIPPLIIWMNPSPTKRQTRNSYLNHL